MFGKIEITPADKWFSFYIRFRDDWTCVSCGRYCLRRRLNNPDAPMIKIECAHVYGRGHENVRHDEDNAFTLCYKCHEKFTANDKDWLTFCEKLLGEKNFQALTIRRHITVRSLDKVWGKKNREKAVASFYRKKVIEMAKNSGREWIVK